MTLGWKEKAVVARTRGGQFTGSINLNIYAPQHEGFRHS
jgi:hypothetical protein